MKKLAVLVMVTALLLTSSLATAQGPHYGSEYPYTGALEPGPGGKWVFSTMVEKGWPCGFGPYGPTTFDSHAVMARNGIQTLVCVGEAYPEMVPDRAEFDEGFPCMLHFLGIWTYVSKLTITPAGKVTMTCHTMQSVHEE